MRGGVFFDANLLVHAVLQPDPRSERARDLLARGGAVSVQVLNEFANVARRKLREPWPEVAQALSDIRVLCSPPLPITLATHEAALGIAARLGYGFYDSLVIASALEAGCAKLCSEDMQDGQTVEGALTIRDPFKP
ncbi:PIN domain-containing protein [Craurococcus roseus]|uniref:Ribonuclease VapC n=1 Tax=Craurococcus roseus TaxID=77585 RepID=A0ABN1GBG2_9PROT